MESADKNREKNTNQEWDDPTFSWDEMQVGIFDKITEEQPDFFEEKRRRRTAVWFWFGAAALLLGGFGLLYFSTNENAETIKPIINKSTEENKIKERPIAEIKNEPGKSNQIYSDNKKQASDISSQINSSDEKSNYTEELFSEKQNNKTEFSTNKNSKTSIENLQKNTILSPAPETKTSQNKTIHIPNKLAVNTQFVKLETNPFLPPFSINNKAEKNTKDTPEPNLKNENKKGQWTIAATGGSIISFSKLKGNSSIVDLRNDHTSPFFGYQYGVDISAPLSEKSHLIFGAGRTVVYQNIDVQTVRQVEVLHENALVHVTHYVVGDRVSEVRKDTLVSGIERNRLVKYNEFKSTQIHAGYGRSFEKRKWNFSPFAGVAVGLINNQKGYAVAEDKSIFSFDKDNPLLNRFQIKTIAGLNVERKIGKTILLLFQYRFDQQWNNASAENGMTLRPASHYFSAGVSKHW